MKDSKSLGIDGVDKKTPCSSSTGEEEADSSSSLPTAQESDRKCAQVIEGHFPDGLKVPR